MKKIRLFFLGLIVTGTLLGSFHHHDEGVNAGDCSVCIVHQVLDISGDVSSCTISCELIKSRAEYLLLSGCDTQRFISTTLSRAPPLS